MTKYLILLLIPGLVGSATTNYTPPTPETLERKIYEYKPSTPLKIARPLAYYVYHFCPRSLWFDAIRIAFVESSFRQISSSTQDHGYFQINGELYGKVGLAHPVVQTEFACKLMQKAVDSGKISRYHSKTPSKQRLYEAKLRRLK